MATFGYETQGTASTNIEDSIAGSKYTLSEAGTVTKMTGYMTMNSTDKWTVCGIYDSSYNLVSNGVTNEVLVDGNGWRDFTFSTNPVLDAGDYWLVACGSAATGGVSMSYIVGDPNKGLAVAHTYNASLPASISPSLTTSQYSIYATYTPSGGTTPAATFGINRRQMGVGI